MHTKVFYVVDVFVKLDALFELKKWTGTYVDLQLLFQLTFQFHVVYLIANLLHLLHHTVYEFNSLKHWIN